MNELRAVPIVGLPEIEKGMALGELISAAAELRSGDAVVIAQKAVSKAEGRVVPLSAAMPGSKARHLAAALGKDPALVQLILDESNEVLRAERNVLITETHHGFICANAGIDTSNLPEDGTVCLLPKDPDASARNLRAEITTAIAEEPGVGLAGHSP
ncbi:MAG TPA: coenzyme F420-0:L-glutamate ligase, partial [Solirubrobacterales bacterium]